MTITIDRPTETATPAPARVMLPYSERLLGGIYAVALHAAKNDVTAVVETVRVDARTFIATDRYSVGEWTHAPKAESASYPSMNQKDEPKSYVLVPRSAAEWLSKQNPRALGIEAFNTSVRQDKLSVFVVVFEPDAIIIKWRESDVIVATTRFAEVVGNFPPVARLFPGQEPAKQFSRVPLVSLNPKYLERFTKGAARVNDREQPLRMTLQATDNPSMPGPVLFDFGANSGDDQSFRGLLQPNLILR